MENAHKNRKVTAWRANGVTGKLNYKYPDAPISLLLHVFDTVNKPIMLYGAELNA